jgi:hypothetical protein
MVTYILYVFGSFETHDDVIYFISEVLPECDVIDNISYVIECSESLMIIFQSETEDESIIIAELPKYVINENVKFYFLHRIKDMLSAYLPPELNEMIFKPNTEVKSELNSPIYSLTYLDEILDKIDNQGIDSLTDNEKKFLDDFKNRNK